MSDKTLHSPPPLPLPLSLPSLPLPLLPSLPLVPSPPLPSPPLSLVQSAGVGGSMVTYRLRDWLVSRQRYWGAPIPVVACSSCGDVPVAEGDLPVVLPTDVTLTGKGRSPLVTNKQWKEAKCPR